MPVAGTIGVAFFMSAPEDLETLYNAAAAALDAGDYLAAKLGFMKVMAKRATVPDLERSLGAAGRQGIRWRDADLTPLIALCDKMLAAARIASGGVFQQVPITYARVDATGDYE